VRTPYPEIRRGLDARLLALLPGIGLTAADVAWPNAAFAPDPDKLYLRPWCMFGETATASLGPKGFERLTGVYQISIYEVADTGLERSEGMAQAIIDHFRGGTRFEYCGFDLHIRTAYARGATLDDGRLHIPVSVVWRCDTQK